MFHPVFKRVESRLLLLKIMNIYIHPSIRIFILHIVSCTKLHQRNAVLLCAHIGWQPLGGQTAWRWLVNRIDPSHCIWPPTVVYEPDLRFWWRPCQGGGNFIHCQGSLSVCRCGCFAVLVNERSLHFTISLVSYFMVILKHLFSVTSIREEGEGGGMILINVYAWPSYAPKVPMED